MTFLATTSRSLSLIYDSTRPVNSAGRLAIVLMTFRMSPEATCITPQHQVRSQRDETRYK